MAGENGGIERVSMPTCVCILHEQTEGISNKFRMPQKCTLPSRGPRPRPGSTHLNTIFIMLWPHKVISLELDDWEEFAARVTFQAGMISFNGSFLLLF